MVCFSSRSSFPPQPEVYRAEFSIFAHAQIKIGVCPHTYT